jgi:hypothetical protein
MRKALTTATLATAGLLATAPLAPSAQAGTVDSAHRAANVGYVMGIAGPPTAAVGIVTFALGFNAAWDGSDAGGVAALGGFTLVGVGAAGILVGPPLQAGGAVAGARRAAAEGAAVTPELGYWAWGLWGGSLLSGTVANAVASEVKAEASAPIQTGGLVVGLGCYVGSLVTGRMQTRQTDAAMATVRAPDGRPRLQLSLVPQRDGIRLAGRF